MKNRYKISELAKIFNISRQTLIFYHKKNILIPEFIDKENGYRYYSTDQIWELFFLINLKKAGFSLDEIKQFTEIKNHNASLNFLKNKVNEIDLKIEELTQTKENILRKIGTFEKVSKEIQSEIGRGAEKRIKCYFITLKDEKDEAEMAMIYEKLNYFAKKNKIKDIQYITISNLKNIETEKIIPLKKIGIIIPNELEIEKSEILILKKYFFIKYSDSYINIYKTYIELKKYVEKEGYVLKNEGVEIAEEFSIMTEDGFGGVLEILVEVDKRTK